MNITIKTHTFIKTKKTNLILPQHNGPVSCSLFQLAITCEYARQVSCSVLDSLHIEQQCSVFQWKFVQKKRKTASEWNIDKMLVYWAVGPIALLAITPLY